MIITFADQEVKFFVDKDPVKTYKNIYTPYNTSFTQMINY